VYYNIDRKPAYSSTLAVMLCGWVGSKGRCGLFAVKNCVLPYLSALENAFGIYRHFTNGQVYFTLHKIMREQVVKEF